MIKMTIQDTEETAEFKVLEKPIIQKPLIAESDVVTIDNNLSTYVTGTQKRELTVGLGYLDSIGYETLRRIRDRQYAVLKYPTVTITADEPVDLGYGEDVPSYRQRLVQLKGKNLYDKNSPDVNYYLGTSSVAQNSSGNGWSILLPVDAGETYTFSRDHTVGSQASDCNYAFIATQPTNGTPYVGSRVSFGSNDTFTATAPTGAKYLMVYYAWSTNATNRALAKATFQLELGSTATAYEPYTNIELCKIGTYQDYIHKSGDKWYVHKETNTIPLLSNYNWYISNQSIKFYSDELPECSHSYTTLNTTPLFKCWSEIYSASKVFSILNGGAGIGLTGIDGGGGNHNVVAYVPKASYTVDSWKSYLDSMSASLTYILQTPTETEITNDTLKAQLNALQNSAFDRWTNIETNVQETSLQPYLTVTQGELTDSGKEVMLDGTTEDLLDFVILGDTFQQTYSGKNLWPINSSIDHYNCTITPGDNSLTIVATGTNSNIYPYFYLEADTQYTFSGEFKITNYVAASPIGAVIQGSNGSSWVVIKDDRSEVSDTDTHTFSVSFNSASYSMIRVGFGTNVYNTSVANTVVLSNPQLEKGSATTSFEPYVGGVPAPNPSYPQDVQTVNGSINFDFSGPSGVKKYTMVGKMTLADQRIIDNCGTNEQVQVSFRESKQL